MSLDHGADDDLKLLNVIESLSKTRIRQSVNVHAQAGTDATPVKQQKHPNSVNNSPTPIKTTTNHPILSPTSFANGGPEKNLSKVITRLSEEKG